MAVLWGSSSCCQASSHANLPAATAATAEEISGAVATAAAAAATAAAAGSSGSRGGKGCGSGSTSEANRVSGAAAATGFQQIKIEAAY